MGKYSVLKATLHNGLFIANVKDLGKTLVAGSPVNKEKIQLGLEDGFLVVTIGKHVELVPLANVSSLSVK